MRFDPSLSLSFFEAFKADSIIRQGLMHKDKICEIHEIRTFLLISKYTRLFHLSPFSDSEVPDWSPNNNKQCNSKRNLDPHFWMKQDIRVISTIMVTYLLFIQNIGRYLVSLCSVNENRLVQIKAKAESSRTIECLQSKHGWCFVPEWINVFKWVGMYDSNDSLIKMIKFRHLLAHQCNQQK